jgi:putative lipoprotein
MAILAAIMMVACAEKEAPMAEAPQKPDNSLMRVITGEVFYLERIALPPGAEVIVTLEDQSRADAPATVLTDYKHVVRDQGPPYAFRLVYNPEAIDERMTYGLRAKIIHEGDLLFTSTEHIDPFTGEQVRIRVSRQGGARP